MSAQEDSTLNNLTALGTNEHLGLSELEVRILDFEGNWWRYAGAKEAAIKELFELTAPRYYQLLNDLMDRGDALTASPMLVKRLRRLREARMATRVAR
jgi:hypothetical protein